MNYVTDYKIIYKGIFQEEDFRFEIVPGVRKYKTDAMKLINEAWQEAKFNPIIDIYNGKVISLLSSFMTSNAETGRDQLYLKVQRTDYKSYYGTNVCNPYRIPKTELSNVLAACAVVVTKDGTVFTGLRSDRLAEVSGVWHVPGGTFSEVINPIEMMRKELKEELNISAEDIKKAVCLGFGENLIMRKPEFLCYFHLKLTEKQLIDKMPDAVDKDEHTEYAFVPIEELQNFIEIYTFAPIGKACITRYLEYIQEF